MGTWRIPLMPPTLTIAIGHLLRSHGLVTHNSPGCLLLQEQTKCWLGGNGRRRNSHVTIKSGPGQTGQPACRDPCQPPVSLQPLWIRLALLPHCKKVLGSNTPQALLGGVLYDLLGPALVSSVYSGFLPPTRNMLLGSSESLNSPQVWLCVIICLCVRPVID